MSVSLLFTDIEGSTRLVQELGDRYSAALDQHRALVRAAAEAHGGEEIDCRGDEFSIAFPGVGDAVAAAQEIQAAHTAALRVRIGIHTGEPMLKVRSYKPDVASVDIRMPPTHTDEGLRAAQEIREKHPETGVLVLSQYVESGYALELLQGSAEGIGYLLKDRVSDIKEFAAAVKRVADGGSALDSEVVSRLVGRRRGEDPISQLTPREREVLELMAEGRSNQAIAERLVVTLRAVEKHVTSNFSKPRLPPAQHDHRRALAVLTYLRQ